MIKVDAATCTAEGKRHIECTVCKEVLKEETLPKIDHNYVEIIDKEAKCTVAGAKHEECTMCHDKKASVELPALGHDYVDGVCSRCGDTDAEYRMVAVSDLTLTDVEGGVSYAIKSSNVNFTNVLVPAEIDGKKVVELAKYAFFNHKSVKSVKIEEGVTTIRSSAFDKCANLVTVVLPNTIQVIENGAFAGCTSLKNIVVPEGVTIINQRVFKGCAFESIELSDNVTEIGLLAFMDCTSLKTITLSSSVKSIGTTAFQGCDNIETVNFKGTEAEWLALVANVNNEALKNAKVNYLA